MKKKEKKKQTLKKMERAGARRRRRRKLGQRWRDINKENRRSLESLLSPPCLFVFCICSVGFSGALAFFFFF